MRRVSLEANAYLLTAPLCLEKQRLALTEGSKRIIGKTLFSCISVGTEMAAYMGESPLRPGAQYPRHQGYCNVSEVIDTGDLGQEHKIKKGSYIYTFQSHRDYISVEPSEIRAILPNKADHAILSTAYLYHLPLSCMVRIPPAPLQPITIYGSGVLAICAVQLYNYLGHDCTIISDKKERKEILLKAGAFNYLSLDEAEASNHKHDYALFLTSSWEYWYFCMKLSKRFGNIAVLGFPGRNSEPCQNPLKPEWTYAKQLRIEFCGTIEEHQDSRERSKSAESLNMSRLVNLIDRSILDASFIVTDVIAEKELKSVYERLRKRVCTDNTFILNWQ